MLETKIENLTSAIERLIEAIDKKQLSFDFDTPAEVVAEHPQTQSDTPVADVNVDILQQRCLQITRIERANATKIKELINSYGANLLKDVPADKLGELASKIEGLVQ